MNHLTKNRNPGMILLLCSSSLLIRDKKVMTSIIHKNNIFAKRFIMIPAVQSKVDEIKKRHDDLLQELSDIGHQEGDPSNSSPKSMEQLGKEMSKLSKIANLASQYTELQEELETIVSLWKEEENIDEDDEALLNEEVSEIQDKIENLEEELTTAILNSNDEESSMDAILEIRAGTVCIYVVHALICALLEFSIVLVQINDVIIKTVFIEL